MTPFGPSMNNLPDFPPEYYADGVRQMSLEYNRSQKEFIEEKHGKTLREIDRLPIASRDLVGLFQCSECGKFIELSALRYFGFNVETAKCFSCQKLHFTNS